MYSINSGSSLELVLALSFDYRCAHKLLDTLFFTDIFHYASSRKSKQGFFILVFGLHAVNFILIMFYCQTLWLHTIAFQLRDSSNNTHLSYCFFIDLAQ